MRGDIGKIVPRASAGTASAANGSARLRRQEGGRNRRVTIRLSDEEYSQIGARAAAAGVSLPRLLVESGLAPATLTQTERRSLYAELFALKRQIADLGTKLDSPAGLSASALSVRRAMTRLSEVMARLSGSPR